MDCLRQQTRHSQHSLAFQALWLLMLASGCAVPRQGMRVVAHGPPLVPRAGTALMTAAAAVPELEIHFIKVGQGDSTLVKCPNGDTILVDCGSLGEFNEGAVRSYLRDQLEEEDEIDLLVVTHPDRDHYNEILDVLAERPDGREISVRRLIYVGDRSDYSEDFGDWIHEFPSDRKQRLTSSEFNVFPLRSLDVCGDSVYVKVLAADVQSTFSTSNTASIVLLVSYGAFDAILPGDATRVTEENILNRFAEHLDELGHVEVLKVAHYGSRATSMLPRTDWFDAVNADVAVYSAVYQNPHGHPNRHVADALREHTIEAESHPLRLWEGQHQLSSSTRVSPFRRKAMFLTATNGNIAIRSDGQSYEWSWNQ